MNRDSKIAWALISPLLAFIVIGFVLPITISVLKAFDNPEVEAALPRSVAVLEGWDGEALPGEAAYAALIEDMVAAEDGQAFGMMTRRLNFEEPGIRTLMLQTRRAVEELEPPFAESLPARFPEWGEPAPWKLIQAHSDPYTATYILRSLDLKLAADGAIEAVEEDQAIFIELFIRTFSISLWVTLIAMLIGYPTAYFLSSLSGRAASFAMLCVLVPFWISILVRSTAWFIILQREGPINAAMLALGLIDTPEAIIFTRPAVYIAMVHVMLPFFILPLYSVMRRTRTDYLRAAASLGAPPLRQFLHVYLPLTMPGVAAGGLMVFMLSIGFYITPALVGGLRDQMISYYIAYFTNTSINHGMAAALSLLLLAFTGAIVVLASRLVPNFRGQAKG